MADGSGQMQMGFGFLGAAVEAAPAGETPMTREQRRSRRKRPVRARTISVKRMTKRELEIGRLMYPEEVVERPKTRAECPPPDPDGKRRCPWAGCKWHTYLDINPSNGAIKLNYPDVDDPGEIPEPCSLDLADRGGMTLEQVGAATNITRERVRQLENQAISALPHWAKALLAQHDDRGRPSGKRRLPVVHSEWADPAQSASPTRMAVRVGVPNDDPGVNWAVRERALLRTASRLGRFSAAGVLRASGLPVDDLGPVHRMQAQGLVRRDGDAYVATPELAELICNDYQYKQAAE